MARSQSCQVQFGLINKGEFNAFREQLGMYKREYQKPDFLSSFGTTNKTWAPGMWNRRRNRR